MSLKVYTDTGWIYPVARRFNGAAWLRGFRVKERGDSGWQLALPEDGGFTINPYDTWANYPGASVTKKGFTVEGTNRVTSGDTPQMNPPLNLAEHMLVPSSFTINTLIELSAQRNSYIEFYGTPPLVQDEWRMTVNALRLRFTASSVWWTVYDALGNQTSSFVDMDLGVQTRIRVEVAGTSMGLWVNDQQIFNRLFPNNPFESGKLYAAVWDNHTAGSFVIHYTDLEGAGLGFTAMSAGAVPAIPGSLREVADDFYPLTRIGAAAKVIPLLTDEGYRNLLGGQYNHLVPETEFKFAQIQPQQGLFIFEETDRLLAFARANAMTVHGHSLICDQSTPAWVESGFTNAQVQQIMVDHISAVVGRYEGDVESWDVVDEPLDDTSAHAVRASIWKSAMGRDYIRQAFVAAGAADPKAKLYINEYGVEKAGTKQNALVDLIAELQAAGAPIHGVGLQMHEDMNASWQTETDTASVSGEELLESIQRFRDMGLEVRISEFDVNLHAVYEGTVEAQAFYYREVLDAALRGGARAFCTWGFTDRHSWLHTKGDWGGYGNGLPFDENLAPKPAVQGMLNRLQHIRYILPMSEVPKPNLLVFPNVTDDSDWMEVTASTSMTYFEPDENGRARATKVTLFGTSNHHQWRDLAERLVPNHRHTIGSWVNPDTTEGFSGEFQQAYYDQSNNLSGTTHPLQLGAGYQYLEHEFIAPWAPLEDPSCRILGWGEGGDGEAILLGGQYLIDHDMTYTSEAQPVGVEVPAGTEINHPLAKIKAFYLPTPPHRRFRKVWEGNPQSLNIYDVLENDFDCDPTFYEGNWDWYATEVMPADADSEGWRYLRTHIDEGMYVSSDTQGDTLRRGTGWENQILDVTHAYLEYWVRFKPGFDPVKGGKLPGLYGGNSPSGGEPATNGFSCRHMWRRGLQGEIYIYAMNTEDTDLKSIGRSAINFTDGEKHVIGQEIILNDPGRDNGIARVWIDGQPAFEQHGLVFRNDPAITINGIFATIFFGGGDQSWAAAKDEYIDHGGYKIYLP